MLGHCLVLCSKHILTRLVPGLKLIGSSTFRAIPRTFFGAVVACWLRALFHCWKPTRAFSMIMESDTRHSPP